MEAQAIYNTYPLVVTISKDNSGSITAIDASGNLVTLDESLITTEVTRLQTAYDSQAYARSRKAKYDLLNQDEMRYDDLINSTTTWQDAIAAIKLEYPQ
tara:strand:- start:84 stop:380 length:297 start_codon:yes stop_codon:yes gene_type:complete